MARLKTHFRKQLDGTAVSLCGRVTSKLTDNTRHVGCRVCRDLIAAQGIPETPVKMVVRRNLMSGIEYVEAEDTPLCCSPASETYWSM